MGDHDGTTILTSEKDKQLTGELQVKGPSVFKRYHNHPKDTEKEFTKDKWYMTGDMVEFVPSDGSDGYDGAYKVLGSLNVDIIKTGGFRVSALDVEKLLLEHDSIAEVCVVGVEDLTWGQKVGAVVSFEEGQAPLELNDLREYLRDKLPRNVMGKINKKDLAKVAFPPEKTDQETAAQ